MAIMFNHPILDECIPLEGCTQIIINNKECFSNLVYQLYSEDVNIKIFEKGKKVSCSQIALFFDVLSFNVNSPNVLKLLYTDLENQIKYDEELSLELNQYIQSITKTISHKLLETDMELCYDEITILELIKALGIKIEVNSDTLVNKFITILQIFKYLTKKKVLFFINCGIYLTPAEFKSVKEYSELLQLTVVFLDPREYFEGEKYIIDDDYCLIVKKWI